MDFAIHTSNGDVRLSSPIPTIEEAALAGARICRFSGRTRMFWSVAVHSLIVCALVVTPAAKLYALIHDVASEATIGDILSPLKSSTIKEIEFQVYCHTLRKWNIPLPSPAIVAEVHRADEDAFLGELGAGIAPEGGHFLHRHRRIPPAAVRLTRSYIRKMQAVRNREQWEVAQFMRLYSSLRQEK